MISLRIRAVVTCDRCGHKYEPAVTFLPNKLTPKLSERIKKEILQEIKDEGWTYFSNEDKILCPSCSIDLKRKVAQEDDK